MKLPRDLSAGDLIKALGAFGYTVTRRKGSHIRLTTQQGGEHQVTIPDHKPLRVGTLSSILRDVTEHFGITRDELAEQLFENGP
jgi:predicted RNA binding protein YcfA (HicA-like mRNA interferase family)